MPRIDWIIFSKERTLQLKSCIKSLTSLSDVKQEEITVLYLDSEAVSYESLKKEFACNFVRQKDFYQDLSSIVNSSDKGLVSFIVDDVIFRDKFSVDRIGGLFDKYKELDCFSLRLGKNIKDRRPPRFEWLEDGILTWNTARGLGVSWNFFFEISGSVYRKNHISEYLRQCQPKKITYPNPFEYYYYRIFPNFAVASKGKWRILKHPNYLVWLVLNRKDMVKKMACFEKSRSFTQGINVTYKDPKYKTYLTVEKMHELYLKGYEIDFISLKNAPNVKPNAGRQYFRIVDAGGNKHPLSLY